MLVELGGFLDRLGLLVVKSAKEDLLMAREMQNAGDKINYPYLRLRSLAKEKIILDPLVTVSKFLDKQPED